MRITIRVGAKWILVFGCGLVVGRVAPPLGSAHAQASSRVFEIRTYTASDGRLDALHARFRDHNLRILQKYGITNIAYFKPLDAPLSQNTMMYVVAHPSRDAARKAWAGVAADPEFQKVLAETDRNGTVVAKVESVFADPADYSPLK